MSDKKSVIIALGYFDSVHKGHLKVIKTAIALAKKQGVTPAVFTFKGDLKKAISSGGGKCVFTFKERKSIINGIGVKEIFFAPTDKEFIGQTKTEFLDFLNTVYNVKGYVSGEDYTFGRDRGTVADLTEYARSKGQSVTVVKIAKKGEEKISTTWIKALLKEGQIAKANSLLTAPYFITGRVKRGRSVGKDLGFPTANVSIARDKFILKEGVYAGVIEIDGAPYKAAVNYGGRPTYNLNGKLIEAHVIDFYGDLYGKKVKITLYKYLRELKKFSDEKELIRAVNKDVKKAKELKYD